MRSYQALCVALTAVVSHGQYHYGKTISLAAAPAISTLRTSYVAAPAVHTVAAAPALSRTISVHAAPALSVAAVPALTRTVAVHAAPALTVAAAPVAVAAPVARVAVAAAPVARVAVAAAPVARVAAAPVARVAVAAAPASRVQTHEVHTGSGRQAIRIEDYQAGDQVIRVHEGPQAAPQIAQVQVPGDQHHIRVVNHQAGPAHVERVVHRQHTQVIDVQKPGRPGARIVQVVRGESPAPSIEFVNAGGSDHHVYHANDAGSVAIAAAPAVSVAAAPAISVAAPAISVAAPTFSLAAPVVTRSVAVHAAPVVSRSIAVHAAPAISVAAPVVHRSIAVAAPALSTRVISAPSTYLSGISYGAHYGSHGQTVVLNKA